MNVDGYVKIQTTKRHQVQIYKFSQLLILVDRSRPLTTIGKAYILIISIAQLREYCGSVADITNVFCFIKIMKKAKKRVRCTFLGEQLEK